MSIVYIMAAILILGGIIFFHEAGHFLAAKVVGVKVKEFALGFGHKLISRKFGQTEYSLRMIPLGGFISMAEEGTTEEEKADSWHSQPVIKRFAIAIAGPLMNFALALVLFSLVTFVYSGVPAPLAQVGQVSDRAAEAGLRAGDTIVMVNEKPVQYWQQVDELVRSSLETNPEKEIEMLIDRNGERQSFSISPEEGSRWISCIGIDQKFLKFRLLPSIYGGARMTGTIIWASYTGLVKTAAGAILAEDVTADFIGPIGIVGSIAEGIAEAETEAGDEMDIGGMLVFAAFFAGFMSIAIGLFNLLPVPGLDGSQLMFSVIEVMRGRPDPKKETFMRVIGGLLIILFVVIITYQDIARLFF